MPLGDGLRALMGKHAEELECEQAAHRDALALCEVYEAQLASLRAQLQEAQAWQPTGWHNFSDPNSEGWVIVSDGGRTIGMYEDEDDDDDTGVSGWAITLPEDFALCRRGNPSGAAAQDGSEFIEAVLRNEAGQA